MRESRTAGYQSWNNLLFIHWRCTVNELQSLVPPELTIETFDGAAWVGLVPFQMASVRPWWSPPLPGISWFLETNVRTYVRHENGTRGVWFFSLDANGWLAVQVAKRGWFLPYFFSRLDFARRGSSIDCRGQRPDGSGSYSLEAKIDTSVSLQVSQEGSLEEFLLERYTLFAPAPAGLRTGQVHHAPYKFQPVEVFDLDQDLVSRNGIRVGGEPDHAAYSPGVDVRVSPLEITGA